MNTILVALVWRHKLSQWCHPSCVISIGHRLGLLFLLFSAPRSYFALLYVILHPIAGRASIGLGYEIVPYEVMCRLPMTSSRKSSELIQNRLQINSFLSAHGRIISRINSLRIRTRKKICRRLDSNPRPWAWLEQMSDALDRSTTTAWLVYKRLCNTQVKPCVTVHRIVTQLFCLKFHYKENIHSKERQ